MGIAATSIVNNRWVGPEGTWSVGEPTGTSFTTLANSRAVPQPPAVVDGVVQVAPHGVGGVPGDVRCQHDVVQRRAADCPPVSARRRRRRGPPRPACPARSASTSASSSTTAPREVLTSTASGFIRASAARSSMARGRVGQRQVQRDDVAGGQQVGQRPPAGVAVVAGAGVQHLGTHGRDDRLDALGDVAVADQPDRAAADVAHRLAEGGVGRPARCRRGSRGPARAAGAARPASAAPCPRRPTARSRRACSRPRCPAGSRRRRRWCSPRRPACARACSVRRLLEVGARDGRSTCQITSASGSSR